MDGTLAAIFLILGLGDMAVNDCPTGCLKESRTTARWNFQAASVIFNEDRIGQEFYAAYDPDQAYGPFQLTFGGSATLDGDLWVGGGAKWTSQDFISGPFFFEASLMPGLYARGDGPEIGGVLQFRSALGAGYEFGNGATLTVLFDHRSNADIQVVNPGLETLGLRYAIALD
ncbi:MAG: acyloxyacyl hydrolase [Yoonia sp.]|uniref:acyloxyacyl hydrolase n=1 Tax=Yoonia sp. TaxID=2212373 RepID=UPI003EF0A377